MLPKCPTCQSNPSASGSRIKRSGRYRRKSDQRFIQIYKCLNCDREFIKRTPTYRQLKRQINNEIGERLASGCSQRRIAMLLGINRKTVARKLVFLGEEALRKTRERNLQLPKAKIVIFDDLETFEHTKMKPLSVTLAVDEKRRILDFQVSRMAAGGLLAKPSIKKYGKRKDERRRGRNSLFKNLKELVTSDALFRSDQNPHYPRDLKYHFPKCVHETHKGRQGAVTGQGELKKIGFDPLFALNHTCAMFRANINRLFRKTWCTTKRPDRLMYHIAIYMEFHNFRLLSD